jgi:serine/threonine protein kinase
MGEMDDPLGDSANWQNQDLALTNIKDKDLTSEYPWSEQEMKNYPTEKLWEDHVLAKLKYQLGDQIGQGGHASVYMAYTVDDKGFPDNKEGEELACKVMALTDGTYGVRNKQRVFSFKNELFALVRSKHENIIAIKDNFIMHNKCYLMMEFADLGSLDTDRKKTNGYKEVEARDYFSQISSAIFYMHCRLGYAHLDIKLGNILLVGRGARKVVKVADFGLSRLRIKGDEAMKEYDPKGTVPYMSPQVLHLYIRSTRS